MALTATEAARRLNRTERTVRRWIATGELKAFHPTHGRKDKYLIEEREVERLAAELAKEQSGHKQGPAKEDVSSLTKEVEKLRREIVDVKTDVKALEQLYYKLQGQTPGPDGEASFSPPQSHTAAKRARTRTRTPAEPPVEGAIEYWQFAKRHGVNRITFRDQIIKGSKRSGERVEAIREGDTYWLSPEQQRAALQFWQARGTSGFRTCPDCPHT